MIGNQFQSIHLFSVVRTATAVLLATTATFSIVPAPALHAEDPIAFDIPSLIGVHEIECVSASQGSGSQKIIEVVIPISTEIANHDKNQINDFRFDVFWNRNVYPLEDYGPKTRTTSDIEGLITVEKSTDKTSGVGFNLKASIPVISDTANANANADFSQKHGVKLKYQEVPQHEILVASGTIQRGTGAFFRFHPSKRETLEGGRDLVVAYRVPQSWRGGVIKVECRASGQRQVIGSWRESFESNRAFVLPIYLDGDDQARVAAEQFVRSEQGLRQNWSQFQSRPSDSVGLFGFYRTESASNALPTQWVHHLIQSGHDSYLNRYRNQLPGNVVDSADKFVIARQELFKLSR